MEKDRRTHIENETASTMQEREQAATEKSSGTLMLIIGISLMVLQFLSIAGELKFGTLKLAGMGIPYFIGRFGIGIIGFVLVAVAINKKTKRPRVPIQDARPPRENAYCEVVDVEKVFNNDKDADAFSNDKYSLKGFAMDSLYEIGIVEELSRNGIDAYERKCSGNVLDGSFKQETNINPRAFTKVCAMLTDERREKNLTKNNVRELVKRLRLRNITLFVLLFLLIFACFLSWHFYNENAALQTNIKGLESSIRTKNSRIELLEDEVADGILVAARLNSIEDEYEFFHKYAVIIPSEEGEIYHHHGCKYIEGKRFYIFNISKAETSGYEPCLFCFGE